MAGDANLYRYVGNSPTNATDPSGLITFVLPGGFNEFGTLPQELRNGARYRVMQIPNPPNFGLPSPFTDPLGNIGSNNALRAIERELTLYRKSGHVSRIEIKGASVHEPEKTQIIY
jgi:hypothetical protein